MKDIGKQLKYANNQMNRSLDNYARQHGATGMQMSILDYLGEHQDVLQHNIETEFGIQRSTMTVILQRMEKAGLVYRQESTTDARRKIVNMTPKGRQIQILASKFIQKQQRAIETAIPAEQLAIFEHVLQYFINLNGRDNS